MKKYFIGLMVVVIAGCSNVKPRHEVMDNSDIALLNQCEEIQNAFEDTSTKLADLNTQKLGADAGNAMNTAGGLLSLNPLAALDHTRTGDLEVVIVNYSERLDLLKKRATQKQCTITVVEANTK
ncbi:hypothetical protein [Ignatzschineria sp. LJL83]